MAFTGLHHVRFEATDLDAIEAFASDFGLSVAARSADRLYMRTQGGDACCYIADKADKNRFVGFTFTCDSRADFDRLIDDHGALPPVPLDTPGGGEMVTLTDPNGFTVGAVFGEGRIGASSGAINLAINNTVVRRREGTTQHKHALGPARLNRLGHIGLFVTDFMATAAWYERVFGLIGSDVYHVPNDPAHRIVGFFRLDRGSEWTDHHTVALMQREQPDCHHISFEAQDYEEQFMAHRWLASQGHESIWGVGRHPHGSHVFDVWRDPGGWRFETFSDTDVLNADTPTTYHDIRNVQMDLWSADPPDRYFA